MSDNGSADVGLFGKIPALGDFVSRNIERQQMKRIDAWLQAGLIALQSASVGWLDGYLVAPVWQFVLPRNQWCTNALCGSLMPSVDRIGRYFPLVTTSALSTDPGIDLAVMQTRLSRFASIMPRALRQDLDVDDFAELLRRPDLPATRMLLPLLGQFNPDGDRSLWWAERSENAPFREILHRGSPDDELFLRLFGL